MKITCKAGIILKHKLTLKWIWLATFLLISLLETGLTAFAQTQNLTLSKAIELSLKADYTIKSDMNTLEKAKLAVKKGALDIFPTATVEGEYQYLTADQTYPSGYQIVVTETIPTKLNLYGKTIATDIDIAMWDQVSAEAALQVDAAEVIYNTYNDFLTVLEDQQLLEQYEKAVAEYTATNELAKVQLSLGVITKPDQLQIENYLNNAQYNLEKGRSDLEIAQKILANQLGLKDLDNYQLETLSSDSPAVKAVEQELNVLQQQALKKRLELREDEINIKKAQRTWAGSVNDQLPTVSLGYNDRNENNYFGLNYNFLSGDFVWTTAQSGQSNSYTSSSSYFGSENKYFTLKLSWNLDCGSTVNTAKQNLYSLENTKLALEKQKTDIALEVQQALANYQLALKQHQVDQKALEYYEKSLEIKATQAKLHAITYSDYYEAMQNDLEAKVTALKSGYAYILALQKLKQVTGELYPFDSQTALEDKKDEKQTK
jgi:outer membrane protein TolC